MRQSFDDMPIYRGLAITAKGKLAGSKYDVSTMKTLC